jgi:hypothetical protein
MALVKQADALMKTQLIKNTTRGTSRPRVVVNKGPKEEATELTTIRGDR